jgi:GntR family transcriptional regulator of vanillate catabolism
VSRTPVRNALSTLGAEGLLDYTPNSGYVVRSYSSKDIADIYEVRAVLDGLAAKTLAEQGMSDARRGALHKIITDGANLVSLGRWSDEICGRWIDINEQFHAHLIDATDNEHLRAMYRKAKDIPLVTELRFRWFDGNDMIQSQSEHSEIFDAIVNKQVIRADSLAREHTYRSGRRIVENWRVLETKQHDSQPRRDVA